MEGVAKWSNLFGEIGSCGEGSLGSAGRDGVLHLQVSCNW